MTNFNDSLIQLPPWSFSMIEQFEQCPRKAYHKYILKEKGPETEAMRKGNEFDKAVEERLKTGRTLPAEWQHCDPFAESIYRLRGNSTIYTQLKVGVTRNFEACDFFSKIVWGRGVLDVAVVRRGELGKRTANTAMIIDWKTGKNREGKGYGNDGLQLKIFAGMLFNMLPGVDNITAFNIYVKSGEIGKPYAYNRGDIPSIWADVIPRVAAMEKAFSAMAWPERPGALCGYCDVKTCQFNRS